MAGNSDFLIGILHDDGKKEKIATFVQIMIIIYILFYIFHVSIIYSASLIQDDQEEHCSLLPQSILSNLNTALDPNLTSSLHHLSSKWTGGNTLNGNELIDHTFGCGMKLITKD